MNDVSIAPSRHKLDVETLYRMAEAGIFGEHDRIELIDGELIDMAPIGQDHAATVNALNHSLVMAFNGRAIVSVQNPVRVDDYNEPQPDFVVLRPRGDKYRHGQRGGPEDALLVVEVADSSLRFDRTVKAPLYARAGFAELWIIDLKHRLLTVYRQPVDGEYAEIQTYRPGDTVTLALAPDIAIPLVGVFE